MSANTTAFTLLHQPQRPVLSRYVEVVIRSEVERLAVIHGSGRSKVFPGNFGSLTAHLLSNLHKPLGRCRHNVSHPLVFLPAGFNPPPKSSMKSSETSASLMGGRMTGTLRAPKHSLPVFFSKLSTCSLSSGSLG